MGTRAFNFNAGPAALPLEVLQQAQEQFVEYNGIGMSIMEISHRSKIYEHLNAETEQLILELLQAPSNYRVLFMQGGASSQFAYVPMNFAKKGQVTSYVMSGAWADKAIEQAHILGHATHEIDPARLEQEIAGLSIGGTSYVHMTSNETIAGSQFHEYPKTGEIPLIADMSSDIMSKPIDVSQFALIYAGAQKNLGPSGVTIVIIREEMIARAAEQIPTMFRYDTYLNNNSLYNTPPVYSIYMVNLVMKWIKSMGGLAAIEQHNQEKAALIYDQIDQSDGFYYGSAEKALRSLMNITFRLQDEQLEKKFIDEATAAGFVGLKGHRSIGGLRASTYNAVPRESCEALASFMAVFRNKHA